MGGEEYSLEEMEKLPEEVQLLEPDKEREKDLGIVKTHLETLCLLTTTREGREVVREMGVYPVVRECHASVEDEEVRELCDRFVQVVMRDEDGEGADDEVGNGGPKVQELDEDDDDKVIDVLRGVDSPAFGLLTRSKCSYG